TVGRQRRRHPATLRTLRLSNGPAAAPTRPGMRSLFVNRYRDAVPERQNELDECLRCNLRNPLIDRVVALTQDCHPISDEKLVTVPVATRPTYKDFFDTINSVSAASDINILANSDIFFDDTLASLQGVDLRNRCLALTRWDVAADGTSRHLGWQNSQDAWIVR